MEAVEKAKKFVEGLLKERLSDKYIYHNISHTEDVAATCLEIAQHENLSNEQIEVLLLAAWFHDTGYVISSDNHEENSVKIMRDYFENENYDPQKIDKIAEVILSTRNDCEPKNIKEKIIRDADLAHIGRSKFESKGDLLRHEWQLLQNKNFSDLEWEKNQLEFLIAKKFYTDYAKEKLGKKLLENISDEKKRIEKAQENETVKNNSQ